MNYNATTKNYFQNHYLNQLRIKSCVTLIYEVDLKYSLDKVILQIRTLREIKIINE